MFKCQKCGKQVGPKEPQFKKIIETRPTNYYNLCYAKKNNDKSVLHFNYVLSEEEVAKLVEMNYVKHREKTSNGWEIAKELLLCRDCFSAE